MPTTPCDCLLSVSGLPDQWSVLISGTTNAACIHCSGYDGTWVVAHNFMIGSCTWMHGWSVMCNVGPGVFLTVTQNADGTSNITVYAGNVPSLDNWSLSNVVDLLSGPFT